MPMLKNGDVFPTLNIPAEGGGKIALPDDLRGSYAVILIYRGAWRPLCNAQLADYAATKDALDRLGVKVVALSVEDEATTGTLRNKHGLTFPIGVAANADEVAAATGAFTNVAPRHLQPTSFILDPNGSVMAAVYATHAVGRLIAADAVTFISYMKAKASANQKAAE
jgi:peroxiredoxin